MNLYDFTVKDNKGNDVSLSEYKGKVLLVVNTAPVYKYLKEQIPGRIQWNFAKFLIDKEGNVVARFAPSEKPETLVKSIESELSK
ncbi:MAG: hypothetical protein IJ195_08600 [Lachnospiraceae bacterium]|nr:hypothetical protein [Lachnospiraceae bacterium]